MLTDILGLRFASLASQLNVEPGQRIYSLSYSDIDCVMLDIVYCRAFKVKWFAPSSLLPYRLNLIGVREYYLIS